MKLNLKKIDLSGIKDFMFHKGERLGLAVCGVIALLFLVLGLMKVASAGATYGKDFETLRTQLERKIGETGTLVTPKPPEQPAFSWRPQSPRPLDSTAWGVIGEPTDTWSRNPEIIAIADDAEHLSVKFIKGGAFTYDVDKGKVALSKASKKPIFNVEPVRMVVVQAIFPMKLEWQEYHQQLNYHPQAELEKEDQPRALGIIVDRREVKADGKTTEWEPVYWVDKEDKVQMPDRLSSFFKKMVVDQDNKVALEKYLMRGLTTPLPKLANVTYPPMPFKDFKEELVPPPVVPKGSGGNIDTERVDITTLDQSLLYLSSQLTGKIDYFDATGLYEGEAPKVPTTYKRPSLGQLKKLGGGIPTINTDKVTVYDRLIRFIDVGVEPGKTYEYTFKVRFANPNFQKTEDVLYSDLANIKEIESPFVNTPPVYIPEEFYYYATDEMKSPRINGGSDADPARAEAPLAYGLWNTPVQIHSWIDKEKLNEVTVADWAIAERLLVRRGESIGRHQVMVEVPVWNPKQQKFEIGNYLGEAKKGKKATGFNLGMPIDFIRETPPPLLVDFSGGNKHNVRIAKGINIAKDESAVDLLILTSDGNLIVRNSRLDSDGSDPANNPIGAEREKSIQAWREKIHELRKAATPANKGGAPLPAGGGGFQLPGGNK
jgi:hypothetical protein